MAKKARFLSLVLLKKIFLDVPDNERKGTMDRWKLIMVICGVLAGAVMCPGALRADEESLAGYWPFSENEGTITVDESGNGHDGTIHGAAWTTGKHGAGLEFDGEDDYVQIPASESLSIIDDITLTAWIYPRALQGGIVTQRLHKTEDYGMLADYGMSLRASGLMFLYNNGTDWYHNPGGTFSVDEWSFVAVTRNIAANKISYYVNGVLTNTIDAKGYAGGVYQPVSIGGSDHDGYLKGIIDEVRIYNEDLGEENIRKLFEGKPLIAIDPSARDAKEKHTAAAFRNEVPLRGVWQFMPVEGDKKLIYPPPEGKWMRKGVPNVDWAGQWTRKDVHRFWYKREFTVPGYMQGKRLKLKFMAVNFDAQVYVNGKHAGGHYGGYTPFMVDITGLVKKDGANELCVAVTDWVAACTLENPGKEPPGNSIIAPIGGIWQLVGIWQPVYLTSHPAVYTEDVFVMTSVRQKEIKVQVQIKNEDSVPHTVEIGNSVYDADRTAVSLPSQIVKVEPAQSQVVTIAGKWETPRLWFLDEPYLYRLKTDVRSDRGETIDELSTRFGFREVWTEGKRFILNGTPVTLFAADQQSSGGIIPWTVSGRQEAIDALTRLKGLGVRSLRLHTQPFDPSFLEAADEVGILIVDEAAVYAAYRYAVDNEHFWKNYAGHMQGLVRRDRNHPSLYMYSLENEIIFAGGGGGKPEMWRKGWVELADMVRKIDPTRLIICEADDDPGGVMDMRGFHYTAERYQGYTDYPNKCYGWLDGLEEYMWQPGWKWADKPIYYGEFAGYMPYHPHYDAFWLGDKAYVPEGENYMNMWNSASQQMIIDLVAMEIAGLRYQGVTGICPYAFFPAQSYETLAKKAYAPLFVDIKEWGHHFKSGETIQKTLIIYNDLFKPLSLKVRWQARMSGKLIKEGELTADIGPGEFQEQKVGFPAPEVSERSNLDFEVGLYNGAQLGCQVRKEYTIFPSALPPVRLTGQIGLYDTAGDTRRVFNRLGVRHTTITDLSKLSASGLEVLVIGANSVDSRLSSQADYIAGFVSAGGRAVCLEQDDYPFQWLPVQLSYMEIDAGRKHSATIAFPRSAEHPLVKGLEPEDFKFWRQDHIVAGNSPLKPLKGNFKVVIDAGGISAGGQGAYNINGLKWAPLIEVYHGRGLYLLSQLRLVEKFADEPVAQEMLVRMLNYAGDAAGGEFRSAGVMAEAGGPLRSALDSVGLLYDDLKGRLTGLSSYGLLLVGNDDSVWREAEQNIDRIRGFVKAGGVVWLRNLRPAQRETAQQLLGIKFRLQEASVEPLYKIREDEVISGLSNDELYWRQETGFDQIGPMRRSVEFGFYPDGAAAGVESLTNLGGLIKVKLGEGFFLVDQILWDSTVNDRRKGLRLASILLTNLGAKIESLSANPKDYFQVDLSPYANLSFSDKKEIGWADDEKGFLKFPAGSQTFNGVPFKVIKPDDNNGKSAVALSSSWKTKFTMAVENIPVGRKASKLYFLQSCSFDGGAVFGRGEVHTATYVINYNDGAKVEVPVRNNMEVWEWFAFPVPKPYAEVAWVGRRPGILTRQIAAYSMEWLNPYPEKAIDSFDFISANNTPLPILIAVSGRKM